MILSNTKYFMLLKWNKNYWFKDTSNHRRRLFLHYEKLVLTSVITRVLVLYKLRILISRKT